MEQKKIYLFISIKLAKNDQPRDQWKLLIFTYVGQIFYSFAIHFTRNFVLWTKYRAKFDLKFFIYF